MVSGGRWGGKVRKMREERRRERKKEGRGVDGSQPKILNPPIDHQDVCLKVAHELALVL